MNQLHNPFIRLETWDEDWESKLIYADSSRKIYTASIVLVEVLSETVSETWSIDLICNAGITLLLDDEVFLHKTKSFADFMKNASKYVQKYEPS